VILVTGGTGFIGSALIQALVRDGKRAVTAAVRRQPGAAADHGAQVVVASVDSTTDWTRALAGAQVVVHLAARVHEMRGTASVPLSEYRRTNVDGSVNLARQSASHGVRRFVFVSSIKVNGDCTMPGQAFSADDEPAPQDAYAESKQEAEAGLREVARATGMEVVVVRPPLVYGPGVKGNFLSMMRWLSTGIPLPLGAVQNRRSLVALDNLVNLLATCIDHAAAANQTFLVSDGEDVSTPDLLRRLARALGKSACLLPVPEGVLTLGATMLGRGAAVRRLCGSLCVDIGKTRQLLGWSPPLSVDEGLRRAAEAFLREART
jgi:nucleoside-diphosphate-sugar epimerase